VSALVSPPYDPGQRKAADRIQRQHPAWLVMYGPWTRHFWAYPLFPVPRGTILNAPSTGELVAWMRTTELAASDQPPARPGRQPG
jgi:hypothetical protein